MTKNWIHHRCIQKKAQKKFKKAVEGAKKERKKHPRTKFSTLVKREYKKIKLIMLKIKIKKNIF